LKAFMNVLIWSFGVILLLQFIRIDIPKPPKATPQDEIKAPKEIMSILKTSCYDCHSNETKMPWYGNISPIAIGVHSNIKNGRAWLNFSIFNKYDEKKKQKIYKGIVDSLRIRTMPPSEYLLIHRNARLTAKKVKILSNWAKNLIKEDK